MTTSDHTTTDDDIRAELDQLREELHRHETALKAVAAALTVAGYTTGTPG